MKRNPILILLALTTCLLCTAGFAACGGAGNTGGTAHKHTYSEEWTFDETYHWHAATCGHTGEVSGKAEHTFLAETCTICGYALSFTEGLEYTLINNGTAYEVSDLGSATDTDIVIPSVYNDLPVTSIGEYAFMYCTNLKDIKIPDSVTRIGKDAFVFCSSVKSIEISDNVTRIENETFGGCSSLTSITIPNSVTSIEDFAFADCSSLTSITIPNSVTSIGEGAFADCSSLTSIALGSNVTSIGYDAFNGCSSLTSIEIPDNVTSIGRNAFAYCSSLTNIIIPNSTSIWNSAFYDTAYYNDDTNWENGMLYIGTYLIDADSLFSGSYTVKPGTRTIANSAFSGCHGLTSIAIPDSVTGIGENAFSGCFRLTSVDIQGGVTNFGVAAFMGCRNLTSVTLGSGVTSIGDSAFNDCNSLASIEIPNSVTSIGTGAFYNCTSLSDLTFNGTIAQWKAIDKDAYWDLNTCDYSIHCTDGDIPKN